MRKNAYLGSLLIFLSGLILSINLFAQDTEKPKQQKSSLGVSLGVGSGFYLKDQPTVPNDNIYSIKPVISAKFYWQPPYRIQLGLETGYYPFYTTTAIQLEGSDPVDSRDQLTVLPIMFNVSMRVWKELRISASMGPCMLFHSNESFGQTTSGNSFSAANFMLSASYLQPLTNRFSLGGEASFFYIGKTLDNQVSLKAVAAYRFF